MGTLRLLLIPTLSAIIAFWLISSISPSTILPEHITSNFLHAARVLPRIRHGCCQVRPFYHTRMPNATNDGITVITQLSVDRFDRLVTMAQIWGGPISAAVYVRRGDDDIASLGKHIIKAGHLLGMVDVHLVFESLEVQYPVNTLRNIALLNARTETLLLLDVDMVPNVDVRNQLLSVQKVLVHDPLLAFVLPCLESRPDVPLPIKNKAEMLTLVDAGVVQQVHKDKGYVGGHAHKPTQYDKFYATSERYLIEYDYFFEPYIMVRKSANFPVFDETFSGYGNDKASHTYEMIAAGYRFEVLPESFVVHRDHGVPEWRLTQRYKSVWVNWNAFVRRIEVQYGWKAKIPDWLLHAATIPEVPRFWDGET